MHYSKKWPFIVECAQQEEKDLAHVPKRTRMEYLSQVAIFIAAISMVFVGSGNPWGFVIAFLIQPFWFYTSYNHRQWGLFFASIIYAIAWILAIYRNWDFYMSSFGN